MRVTTSFHSSYVLMIFQKNLCLYVYILVCFAGKIDNVSFMLFI